MSRIRIKDVNHTTDLSTEQSQAVQGGFNPLPSPHPINPNTLVRGTNSTTTRGIAPLPSPYPNPDAYISIEPTPSP